MKQTAQMLEVVIRYLREDQSFGDFAAVAIDGRFFSAADIALDSKDGRRYYRFVVVQHAV